MSSENRIYFKDLDELAMFSARLDDKTDVIMNDIIGCSGSDSTSIYNITCHYEPVTDNPEYKFMLTWKLYWMCGDQLSEKECEQACIKVRDHLAKIADDTRQRLPRIRVFADPRKSFMKKSEFLFDDNQQECMEDLAWALEHGKFKVQIEHHSGDTITGYMSFEGNDYEINIRVTVKDSRYKIRYRVFEPKEISGEKPEFERTGKLIMPYLQGLLDGIFLNK